MHLRRHLSPMRIAVAVAMTAAAFWICDVGARYVIALLPSMSLSASSPDPVEFSAFLGDSLDSLPLGLELTPGIPLALAVVGSLAVLFGGKIITEDEPTIAIDPRTQHGVARFATVEERAQYAHTKATPAWPKPDWCEELSDDNIIVSQHSRVGFSSNPDRSRRLANKHVFLQAGSGAGKTYNWLRSNVLQLNASMVFTDMKGENFRNYGKFLARHGYRVLVFNVRGEDAMVASVKFNPLHYVHNMTDLAGVIDLFIKNTTDPDSRSGDDYFVKAERQLYSALLGYLFFFYKETGHEEECTIPKMLTYLALSRDEGQGVTKLDLLFNGTIEKEGFYGYRERLCDKYGGLAKAMLAPEWSVITSYDGFKSTAGSPETMASVVSSCFVRLEPFSYAAVRNLFSADELGLERFGREKTALFIITPDQGSPYYFAVCMLLYQLFAINIDIADDPTDGLDHLPIPINCYLDELANVGVIPNLDKLFATTRSRWINLVAIVQDASQLEAVYGKKAKAIRANCSTFVYLGASSFESCKEISEEMGKTTREVFEWSQSYSQTGSSSTRSVRYVPDDLMSADEIYNTGLSTTECLTHYTQDRWFKDQKPDPETHPRAAELRACGDTTIQEWADERERMRSEGMEEEECADEGRLVLGPSGGTGLDVFICEPSGGRR